MSTHSAKASVGLALFIAIPLIGLLMAIAAYNPETPNTLVWPWLPALGVSFSLRLDGLAFLFVGLICGIGFLIQVYSAAYMHGHVRQLRFHLYLTLFMLSMLGLVLSDDIILLFVFWELTTLTSYLLIGFNHEVEKSRKNALQAMLVTGAGGLALLAGLILLGEMAQTYRLSDIIPQAQALSEQPLYLPSLALILLGALTKSAQFPFHFWLPGAMAAPTPVSAYLHSATMVKAGIYLLARISPIYASSDLWLFTLSITGGITALWTALVAMRQTDLKLMLAHSTNTALGTLTFLLAFGTQYALAAALLFILAHAFYKASLFMVVGNIDKATGTREIPALAGLKATLLFTFIAALLAGLSKAGVPISMGFLGKEYVYKAGLGIDWWAAALMLAVNLLLVAMACVVVIKPFLRQRSVQSAEPKAIEAKRSLWLPPLLLAVLGLLVPILALPWLQANVINPASLAMSPSLSPVEVKLWQGVNKPLILSALTLVLGVLVYRFSSQLKVALDNTIGRLPNGPGVYEALLNVVLRFATWLADGLQQPKLSLDALLFFIVLTLLLVTQTEWVLPTLTGEAPVFYEVSLAALLVAAGLACAFSSSRLLAIASLSVVGFALTLAFMIYSAPDVAKTQLLVETLIIVFLAMVMRRLPELRSTPKHSLPRRLVNAAVATLIGACITMLLINITNVPLNTELTQFFAENSLPGGHGRNVVNVILVDFRAFDTLGEIIVVVVASLATLGLLNHIKESRKKPTEVSQSADTPSKPL